MPTAPAAVNRRSHLPAQKIQENINLEGSNEIS
jgi:hypothetical protein